MRSVSLPWMPSRRPIPVTPACRWAMADVATVLFTKYLRFDPKQPHWPNRDRFVLSAGHGSMLLYSLLYLTGYADMTVEDLKQFRQLGSKTAGHPEYGHATGIETTTGPLGQGIANSVGMAIAERKLREEFGADLQDHYTYVMCGDGCLMEGISHEAIALAGHLKLNKLILFWDNNSITIDGAVSLSDSTDQVARFKAVHWNTIEVDGHDPGRHRRCHRSRPEVRPPDLDRLQDRSSASAHRTSRAPTRSTARRSAPRKSPRPASALNWDLRSPSSSRPTSSTHGAPPARARSPLARTGKAASLPPTPPRRPSSTAASPANCRQASMPPSATTRRSSPKPSRRSPPARHRKTRSKSSTASCRKRSAARPT